MEYYHYILSGGVGFKLGFMWLIYSSTSTSSRGNREEHPTASMADNALKMSQNRKCQSSEMAEAADIIIVGAGVAGSSLAYALGKVTFFFINFHLPTSMYK